MSHTATRNAFTLVELLVTLLILSALIALFAPSLAGARHAAQHAGCLANLRSFGTAITAYTADYRVLPVAPGFYNLLKGETGFLETSAPYLESPIPRLLPDNRILHNDQPPFRCPSDPGWTEDTGINYTYKTGLSYTYVAGAIMANDAMTFHPVPNLAREVTRLYEDDPYLPLLDDFRPWHPAGPSGVHAGNALFFDGRADWHPASR